MKHRLAVLGLTAGLIGGSAAGLAFTVPGVASAQTDQTTTTAPATGTAARPSPADHFREALAPLVTDGTITQAQADAVIAALEQAGPPRGFRGGRGGGRGLEAAATAIGITVDDLRSALAGGQTIAQVAESNGVAVQTVIDAMVAQAKAHLDEHVANGDLTQAQADARLAELTERIGEMVTSTRPMVGPGPRGRAD